MGALSGSVGSVHACRLAFAAALPQTLFMKRTVTLKAGTGKLRGRTCVKVKLGDGDKRAHARHAKKGGRLMHVRFYGCFKSKAEAQKVARRLENARRL